MFKRLVVASILSLELLAAQNLKMSDDERAIVQVAIVRPDNQAVPCGTGFFIRDDGVIATAFHVYAQAMQAMTEARGGTLVVRRFMRAGGQANYVVASAQVKSVDATHDITLLKIDMDRDKWNTVGGTKVLAVSTQPNIDNAISLHIVGYFGSDIFPVTLKANLAGATFVSSPGNTVEEFLISVLAVPGESGSPVMLDDDSVLGVTIAMVPVTVPFNNQPLLSGLSRVSKAESLQRLLSSLPR